MGAKGLRSRQKSQSPWSHCWMSQKNIKLHNDNKCSKDLDQIHKGSLILGSVSASPYDPWLVDPVGCFLMIYFTPLTPKILPFLSHRISKICLILCCGSHFWKIKINKKKFIMANQIKPQISKKRKRKKLWR